MSEVRGTGNRKRHAKAGHNVGRAGDANRPCGDDSAQILRNCKLAKAVEAMQFWSEAVEPDVDKAITLMASTLAELKGQDQ
jgi:hypothetical protein